MEYIEQCCLMALLEGDLIGDSASNPSFGGGSNAGTGNNGDRIRGGTCNPCHIRSSQWTGESKRYY